MNRSLAAFVVMISLVMPMHYARATGVLDFNLVDINTLTTLLNNNQLPQVIPNAIIKTFGIYTAHRSYQGATSIFKSNSMDIFIEGTMVKIGDDLNKALVAEGVPAVNLQNVPAAPAIKVHLVKALNESADIGLSGILVGSQYILGLDLKIVLDDPEEGITKALRIGYTHSHVPISYVTSCTVWSPELVFSRKLYFAEPYIGLGARYITGTLTIPFKIVAGPVSVDHTVTQDGSGSTAYAFTGVYFRLLGAQGLRLGLEGSYDISGYPTMGMVFGLGF